MEEARVTRIRTQSLRRTLKLLNFKIQLKLVKYTFYIQFCVSFLFMCTYTYRVTIEQLKQQQYRSVEHTYSKTVAEQSPSADYAHSCFFYLILIFFLLLLLLLRLATLIWI